MVSYQIKYRENCGSKQEGNAGNSHIKVERELTPRVCAHTLTHTHIHTHKTHSFQF